MEKWITLQDAATLTGYSTAWICRLLNSNRLKGRRWNGRAWQVDRADAVRYAKKPAAMGRPRKNASEKQTRHQKTAS